MASPRSCAMQIVTSRAKSTSGKCGASTTALRQIRHLCSATLARAPSDVNPLPYVTFSYSAARRKSSVPDRSGTIIAAP